MIISEYHCTQDNQQSTYVSHIKLGIDLKVVTFNFLQLKRALYKRSLHRIVAFFKALDNIATVVPMEV